jgi:hypothetical protein
LQWTGYRRASRWGIPALAPVSRNLTGTVLPSLKIGPPSTFIAWSKFDQAAVTVAVAREQPAERYDVEEQQGEPAHDLSHGRAPG